VNPPLSSSRDRRRLHDPVQGQERGHEQPSHGLSSRIVERRWFCLNRRVPAIANEAVDEPAIALEMDIDAAIDRLLQVAAALTCLRRWTLPSRPSWTRSGLLWRRSACRTTSCACGAVSRAARR
jgi:hypothetical protein